MIFVLVLVGFYALCILYYNLTEGGEHEEVSQTTEIIRGYGKRTSFKEFMKFKELTEKEFNSKEPLTDDEIKWLMDYEREG